MSEPLDLNSNVSESCGDEKADCHLHRSEEAGLRLFAAWHAISGGGDPVYFGPEREAARIRSRGLELERLSKEAVADQPGGEPNFTGGEHEVWVRGDPALDVFKRTLTGFHGRILDEKYLLDSRTLLNRRVLFMRSALPSEYLCRWAVLNDIFALPTHYLGQVPNAENISEPDMAISQPYVEQDENDQADFTDVTLFMKAANFVQVDEGKVVNPEIKKVTWYRQRDGILITDAHPRNFRKDLETQFLVPIDLVVTVVPPGVSKLLPEPEMPWRFAEC